MIVSFKHRGLKRLYDTGDSRELKQDLVKRISRILFMLDNASNMEQMNQLPGFRLHPLIGDLKGYWSLSVSGNWRMIFRYENGDVLDLDLMDYH